MDREGIKAETKVLEVDYMCEQGYIYKQGIEIPLVLFNKLQEEIQDKRRNHKSSDWKTRCFLKPFTQPDDGVLTLTNTKRNFIADYLGLKVKDENTILMVTELL